MRRLVVLALTLAALAPAACRSSDFSRLVRAIDEQPGVNRQYIPMLGLARTGVRMLHPQGVQDFRLAVFEHDSAVDARRLDAVIASIPNQRWSPVVRVTGADGERTAIWARERGAAMEMLIVAHEATESVVVEVAMDADRFFEQLAETPGELGRDAVGVARD